MKGFTPSDDFPVSDGRSSKQKRQLQKVKPNGVKNQSQNKKAASKSEAKWRQKSEPNWYFRPKFWHQKSKHF